MILLSILQATLTYYISISVLALGESVEQNNSPVRKDHVYIYGL